MLPLLAVAPPVWAGANQPIIVTTTADENGTCNANCSLREAITTANANAGADTIEFNIPGAGPHTIAPALDLPEIDDRLTIDGYTQGDGTADPGDDATPNANATGELDTQLKIVLAGSEDVFEGLRFVAGAEDSVVKGLVLHSFESVSITTLASGVKIEGNFVGTDVTGAVALNKHDTIEAHASGVRIGGTRPEQRNLISGIDGNAIAIFGFGNTSVSGVTVQGNLIGTKANGIDAVGNDGGVFLGSNAKNATIGGTEDAAGNVIAFTDGDAVVLQNAGNGNRILGNSIFRNAGQGIELFPPGGPDPIDAKDRDSGLNRLQNFPDLTSAVIADTTTTVKSTLRSTPNTKFTVQLFVSLALDGADEGRVFLGQKTVTTNKKGKANFTFTTDFPAIPGDNFTATATNKKTGDTSEFSEAQAAA
jgi:CSLREA domain-containing protein